MKRFSIFLSMALGLTLLNLRATAQCTNQIINGDFEAGNSGFATDYDYVPLTLGVQEYEVTNDPGHPAFQSGDHTSGSGNFMVVNGAVAADQIVWQQSISVQAGVNYSLSAWIKGLASNTNPSNLKFLINGIQVGANFIPTVPNQWQQFSTTWNSGTNTTAVLSIIDQTRQASGDDFGLDDISFTEIDTRNPTITCPGNITVNPTTLAGTVVVYTTPVGSDNCPGSVTVRTAGLASGSLFPIGTTPVTYEVTDAGGRKASCTFNVTVVDPYCDSKKKKVNVCHNGHTNCISINAMQTHLDHGDVLGPCPNGNRGVDSEIIDVVNVFKISVAPNPVISSASIKYEVPTDAKVNIVLYDPQGKAVNTLVDGVKKAGVYNYILDASRLPAGLYFYKMIAISPEETFVQTQKVMIVK